MSRNSAGFGIDGWYGKGLRRFFAPKEKFTHTAVLLEEDETRHLRDVLRLRMGQEVYVMDGEGREYRCRIANIGSKSTELEIIEAAAPLAPESPLELTLAAAILKGDKFDLVVQKSVELGVTKLVPLETVRCEVRLKDAAKKLERWRRIALEAAKQSGRSRLMDIELPQHFSELLGQEARGSTYLFSERDGEPFSSLVHSGRVTAITGPAGGWSDEELELARTRDVGVITLGGRILRAETAAIAVTAILQHRFGDMR